MHPGREVLLFPAFVTRAFADQEPSRWRLMKVALREPFPGPCTLPSGQAKGMPTLFVPHLTGWLPMSLGPCLPTNRHAAITTIQAKDIRYMIRYQRKKRLLARLRTWELIQPYLFPPYPTSCRESIRSRDASAQILLLTTFVQILGELLTPKTVA